MSERRYPRPEREPADTERHQVKRLFGDFAPMHLSHMQRVCDEYGGNEAAPAGQGRRGRS